MRIAPISNVEEKSILRSTLNLVIRQVSDTTGQATLSTGTTTVVNNPKVGSGSMVFVGANNAAASTANAWVSATGNGTFTITHSAGAAGRIVGFAIIGAV
jgi:hypothetical protein